MTSRRLFSTRVARQPICTMRPKMSLPTETTSPTWNGRSSWMARPAKRFPSVSWRARPMTTETMADPASRLEKSMRNSRWTMTSVAIRYSVPSSTSRRIFGVGRLRRRATLSTSETPSRMKPKVSASIQLSSSTRWSPGGSCAPRRRSTVRRTRYPASREAEPRRSRLSCGSPLSAWSPMSASRRPAQAANRPWLWSRGSTKRGAEDAGRSGAPSRLTATPVPEHVRRAPMTLRDVQGQPRAVHVLQASLRARNGAPRVPVDRALRGGEGARRAGHGPGAGLPRGAAGRAAGSARPVPGCPGSTIPTSSG